MALISLQEVKIAFGGPELLDGITLQIGRRERICLVGRNGAGKSTLMKIIGNEMSPDSGMVINEPGLRIAMLGQEVPQHLSGSVFDVVSRGLGNMTGLISDYHAVGRRLGQGRDTAGLMAELERLQHMIESAGGWQLQQRVHTVLSRLALDPDASVGELSGGYKRKVLLAQALVSDPDLLLLDEPTNHLDIDSIRWLEEFLREFSGALLFITHDRRFLQALATRIIELDRGRMTDWPGDYKAYTARRQAELNAEATHNALFDKKLSQEEAWIRQGIKARRTRNEGRVRALKELRRQRLARREIAGSARMTLNEADRSGRQVIVADNICHAYGDHALVREFSTKILRGDKIGIIGPNGSGKTTLLNILLGSLKPLSGSVRLGTNIQIACFDQHRAQLDGNRSIIENIGDGSEHVIINGRSRHIIGYLEDFLFPPERARSPVRVLSGGERNRALLAKLFTMPSNLIVMDEPTNDLDMETLDLLEEMLMDYEGTVLIVSHDREFLNNIVTSTIVFEGSGTVREYVGGYDDWLCRRNSEAQEPTPLSAGQKKTAVAERQRTQKERRRTLSFREKKALEELPDRIEALETERDRLYVSLSDPEFYRQDGNRIPAAKFRLEDLENEITSAYEQWNILEAIQQGSADENTLH